MPNLLCCCFLCGIGAAPPEPYYQSALGVTRKQTPIAFLAPKGDPDYTADERRILLVGMDDSEKAVRACLKWFQESPSAKKYRGFYTIAAVPRLCPDGVRRPWKFPPRDRDSYGGGPNPEDLYLWRWIGVFAPDLVVTVRGGRGLAWSVPAGLSRKLNQALQPIPGIAADGSLADALFHKAPANVGTIPALEAVLPADKPETMLAILLEALDATKVVGRSEARAEILKRLERTPRETAKLLARVYGQDLESVEYIGAMALVGRLRLGERVAVERILAPYLRGTKPALAEKASPAQLAGHLVFGELARTSKDEKAIALLRRAADRCLGDGGVPGHNEMSDSVFMGCPLLALTGSLTGEKRYFEACEKNLTFMRKLTARPDGLYRHSPLDDTAWGRGNGFPALGLALSLSELPKDYAGREAMLKVFREHMEALRKHQEPDGSWHQVIDFPGSYRELSCTCMVMTAMARGVRMGWLEKERFASAIRWAWRAILVRVAADGSLIDVCTGTGKQKSLRDYLDRPAILGRDPRGGAMALLAAVEMADWEGSR